MTESATDQIRWSYRPGRWFGVVGEQVGIVVPADAKDRVASLWEAVDDGADFDTVLDTLVAHGLSGLRAFALVGLGDPTRLLVRGVAVTASVTTDHDSEPGTERVDGSSAGTWIDRTFESVTSLRICLDDDVEGAQTTPPQPVETAEDLLLPAGLVRLGRLDHPGASPRPAAPSNDPMAPVLSIAPERPEASPDLSNDEWLSPGPSDDQESEIQAEEPALDDNADDDSEPDPQDQAEVGAENETEVIAAIAASPPVPPPAPVAADVALQPTSGEGRAEDDHDGMTRSASSGAEFARQVPGIPGQPAAPSVTRTVARLVISDGNTVEVDRVILIGRAPMARRFTSTEQPRLQTVPSPLQEISSTHIEVRPGTGVDHGSAVVTDMGSTNGTVLILPGLEPEDLKPGIAVQLLPGAVINLGDGLTIKVARPE